MQTRKGSALNLPEAKRTVKIFMARKNGFNFNFDFDKIDHFSEAFEPAKKKIFFSASIFI